MIEIQGDIDAMHELTRDLRLSEKVMRQATVSATNKTIVSTRAFAVKEISKEYKVTQKDIRSELRIVRANYRRMEAKIIGSGSPGVPLYKFSPTPKRVPSTIHKKGKSEDRYTWWGKQLKTKARISGTDKYLPKKGIKVMIHRGSRKVVKDAFIAKMRSGHVGVFKRVDSKQLPIRGLFGPSPLRIIDSDFYRDKIDEYAGQIINKNMAHEANYYLRRAGVLQDV